MRTVKTNKKLHVVEEVQYVKPSYTAVQNVMSTLEKCLEGFFMISNIYSIITISPSMSLTVGQWRINRVDCGTLIPWDILHRRAF